MLQLLISYSNAFRRKRRYPQGVHHITFRSSGTPNDYKRSPIKKVERSFLPKHIFQIFLKH